MTVSNPFSRWLRRVSLRTFFSVLILLAAGKNSAWALEISQIRWGFDGQATPHHFNPLSVLVINPGVEPFDGTIELRESIGAGTRVGATLAEEVYLGPQSSRWVQFYPYVKERFEEWSLHWKNHNEQSFGGQRLDLPQPKLAEQTPVWLVAPDDQAARGGTLRRFPENLFPPMVAATDTLKMVALDHAPQWEAARRQSLYDWVFRGGQLHLFKDVNGSFPQFSTGLTELNTPAEQFPIGVGHVFRHDRQRNQVDAEFVAKNLGSRRPGNEPVESEDADESEVEGKQPGASVRVSKVKPGGQSSDPLFVDLTGGLFAFLKSLTRPHHNWALIYSMAVFYILTVIPGVHILGRRRFDYRIVYGALVGLIVLFSLGFAYVGRRGHDEANIVNAVAIARPLPDGAFDVTTWSNVFVINGGDYAISRPGTGSLYSSAQAFEAVHGFIHNGAQAAFLVDIPPYSSQPFLHRTKLKGDRFEIKVQDFRTSKPAEPKSEADLAKLVLVTGRSFPRSAANMSVYALYRDKMYETTWKDGRLELAGASPQPLSQFFESIRPADLSPYGRLGNTQTLGPAAAVPPFETLHRALIAWSLGFSQRSEIPKFMLPADRVRLFVWADLPDGLRVNDPRMSSQQGRMLYTIDVLKPVKP